MRTFFDSTSAADLPATGDGYLGYVDGAVIKPNYDQVVARFPHRPVMPTSTSPSSAAQQLAARFPAGVLLDCESGDYSHPQAIATAQQLLELKATPTIYVDRSDWPDLQARAKAARVPTKLGRLLNLQWAVADWTGHAHLLPGSIATQWADPKHGSGGHYDVLAVADYWPGLDPVTRPLSRRHRRWLRDLDKAWARRDVGLPTADQELLTEHLAAGRRVHGLR